MNIEAVGPVTADEVMAIVVQLRDLSARAADHGQQMMHFVLTMGAESLADNFDAAEEWEGDDAADNH